MRRGFLMLVSALVMAAALAARAQETTATITGVVTDDSGAVLPGVTIVVTHVATNRTYQFVSTSTGAYSATLLPVGGYTVAFTLAGFQPLTVTGVTLNVNARVTINGSLMVGAVAETVQV
ncbi:MAG: carboxypeptidase-like regulatory domain-containing protein, partial [Acidobacteriota bacterium]|nr:carboxypeptidase-like regulatory domain-containing protein [Acidobacteriota bacterium]